MLRSVATPGRLQNLCSVASVRVNSTAVAAPTLDTGSCVGSREWESALPFEDIPGPKALPVIGNGWRIIQVLPFIGKYHGMGFIEIQFSLMQEFGKLIRLDHVPGRRPVLFLYDPDCVETVYRTEGQWPFRYALQGLSEYRSGPVYHGVRGSLVSNGEEWREFRSTVNPALLQPRAAKSYLGTIDEISDEFIERIPKLRNEQEEMPGDFLNEICKCVLETIVMIAVDTRLGCLADNLDPNSEAQQMIDNHHILEQTTFTLEVQIPYWKFVSTPTWRRYHKSLDFCTKLIMKYVQKAQERILSLPQEHELSFLERILARGSNPRTACVMAIDMILAGIDTSSNVIAFLLYYLAINPEAQRKLQTEIDRVLAKTSTQPITAENLNDMKYLKACIKESMRLTPLLPGNMRRTVKDLVLNGYRIPNGTDVYLGHMLMSHMSEHFPEPEKFIPERWLKTEAAEKTHPFLSLPFSFGPRSCLGRRIAEFQTEMVVSKILRRYNIEWHHPPMKFTSRLVNLAGSPLQLKMIERT